MRKKKFYFVLIIMALFLSTCSVFIVYADNMFNQSTINISVECDNNEIPYAVVDKPYEIFKAKVKDRNEGYIQYTTNVYYNYYSDKRVNVSITDGSFVPDREGLYTIVYLAVNGSGQKQTKLIDVVSYSESKLNCGLVDIKSSYTIGKEISFDVKNVSGSSGSYDVKVSASVNFDGETINYYLSNNENEFTFVPYHSGNYSVIITVSDYIVENEYFYSTQVVTVDELIFSKNPIIPKYIAKNSTMETPHATCYDLSQSKLLEKDVKVGYSFDSGAETLVNCGQVITVTGNNTVNFNYYYNSKIIKSFTTKIVDVDYGKSGNSVTLGKYFVTKNGDVSTGKTSSGYPMYSANDDAQIEFINKLSMRSFNMLFSIPNDGMSSIDIIFEDYENRDKKLVINIAKKSQIQNVVTINDETYVFDTNIFSGDSMVLTYESSLNVFALGLIKKTINSGSFSDFSGYAYMSISLNDVNDLATVAFSQLGNQSLLYNATDRISPVVSYDLDSQMKTIGETLEISKLYLSDIITFNSTAKVSVTDPNGEYVKDTNGRLLKDVNLTEKTYIVLDKYGSYSIFGKAVDGFGNSGNIPRKTVNVIDFTSPLIELQNVSKTAHLNREYTVAGYNVTDNLDKNIKVDIFVFLPDGTVSYLMENFFVPTKTGKYVIVYYAMDESENISTVYYEIIV